MIDAPNDSDEVSEEALAQQAGLGQQTAVPQQPFLRVLTVTLVAHGLLVAVTLAAMVYGAQFSLADSVRWGLRVFFLGSPIVLATHTLAVVLLGMRGGFRGGWITCLPILGPRITLQFFNRLRADLRKEGLQVGIWNARRPPRKA